MLTEILMESLLAMDCDTLDYVLESCSDNELDIINSVISEATNMTTADRDDIQFIGQIQRKARSSGWGSVPREDRDRFVDIMSTSKNINVLKKAVKIGEKEAVHDDKVNRALKKCIGGGALVGGLGAGTAGYLYSKDQHAQLGSKINDGLQQIGQDINNGMNHLYGQSVNPVDSMSVASKEILGDTLMAGGLGAAGGVLTGAVAGAIGKKIHNDAIRDRDKRQLAMQGEMKTPTQRWKANRRTNAIERMKAKLNK